MSTILTVIHWDKFGIKKPRYYGIDLFGIENADQ